jgi:hypothetical protein
LSSGGLVSTNLARWLFGQPVALALALFGGLGGGGGDLLVEEGAAVGAEHPVGEEVADQAGEGVLADRDGAGVVGVGGGLAGVGHVQGALVVGVDVVGSFGPVPG